MADRETVKNTWPILVVGNYPADQQQSIIRVAQLLARSYKLKGHRVKLVQPPVLATRLPGLPTAPRKYGELFLSKSSAQGILFSTLVPISGF